MCKTAREREMRHPSVLISEWAVMYRHSQELDGLIISCTQGGGKGGAITAAGVCHKCEVVKRGAEVNERGVRDQALSGHVRKGNKAPGRRVRTLEVRSLSSRRKNLIKLHNLSCYVLVVYSLKFSTVHRQLDTYW